MTMDISNKLIRIANYFRIGMPMYEVTEKGEIKEYTLCKITITILENDFMGVNFYCQLNRDINIDEYFSFKHLDDKEVFTDLEKAQEQAAINLIKYYKEGN